MKEFWTSLSGWMGNGFSIFVYVTIVLLFIIGILRYSIRILFNIFHGLFDGKGFN